MLIFILIDIFLVNHIVGALIYIVTLITLTAALIQFSGKFSIKFFWQFDHNGIFHLVQVPGLVFIFFGAKLSMRKKYLTYSKEVK